MPGPLPTQYDIGRKLRLRDLFVFFAVVDCGSMSKAALRLGVSTPSVSERIADLEHAVGAPLLDRSPRGVVPTRFGETLLARGAAAFDELRQGLREIESIGDPASGEVRIGCPESVSVFLASVIEHLAKKHPRMRFIVKQAYIPYPELTERKIDLVLARLANPGDRGLGRDLHVEVLFDDPFSAVVSAASPWARRRKIDLAQIAGESWIVPPGDAIGGLLLEDAFRARGLDPPTAHTSTYSIHLRNELASRGDFIAVLPRSVLRSSKARYGLKELPLELSSRPSPVGVVTLKSRSLAPSAQVFIAAAREMAKSIVE